MPNVVPLAAPATYPLRVIVSPVASPNTVVPSTETAPAISTELANVAPPVTPSVLLNVVTPATPRVSLRVVAPVTPSVLPTVVAPVMPTVFANVAAPVVARVEDIVTSSSEDMSDALNVVTFADEPDTTKPALSVPNPELVVVPPMLRFLAIPAPPSTIKLPVVVLDDCVVALRLVWPATSNVVVKLPDTPLTTQRLVVLPSNIVFAKGIRL